MLFEFNRVSFVKEMNISDECPDTQRRSKPNLLTVLDNFFSEKYSKC